MFFAGPKCSLFRSPRADLVGEKKLHSGEKEVFNDLLYAFGFGWKFVYLVG